MTYAMFHLVFTIPLLALLLIVGWRKAPFIGPRPWLGMATLIFLAVSYTTPWDSFLIQSGIWAYEPERVLGTLYHIPYEEYFFFVIQTIIGCLFTWQLLERLPKREVVASKRAGLLFALFLTAAFIWGIVSVWHAHAFRYLALIVAWALPICMLQWAMGYRTLMKHFNIYATALASLTVYFWLADLCAISLGIWFFPSEQSSSLYLLPNLPIEEALFFFLTNCMVVQGFLLFNRMPLEELKLR